jgi:2,3-bisphosphoglycerate-independent phosphoglycerate mutase
MEKALSSHGGNELARAVQKLYLEGQTDYSMEPIILADQQGEPIGRIHDRDAVIFCLRRGEREVQLTEAFVEPELHGIRHRNFKHLPFVILTLYHEKFKDLPVAFAPNKISDTLSEIISQQHLRQYHLAESEKFSHVTFFLNGGNNQPFPGETDIRIPSQKGNPVEQNPELSLTEVTAQLELALGKDYDFLVVNFANGDVIGHTQSREAKIRCAEEVDLHLGRIIKVAQAAEILVMITADHGNLEELYTPDGKPHVSHTANPVPFMVITPNSEMSYHLHPGGLADIAPTILSTMGLTQPSSMTGTCLLEAATAQIAQRVLLIILDGWGIGKNDDSNPIHLAHTPNWDRLFAQYPYTYLQASGEAVGLKAGKAGNSEAGHMNIGAGRIVLQDDVRLDLAMQNGIFYKNEIFLNTIEDVKNNRSCLHLISLLSEKSSHGSIDYPLAILRMAKENNLDQVYLHLIFDGRSTQPGSAPKLLSELEQNIADIGIGKIVTGIGRGIALDRDGNYSKTQAAYDALVYGSGHIFPANML